ncbi:hypothetical protein [Dysgonomonas sp. 25]|uniref:DUF6630 family protein n=1 Tax=Dysgonomonas sp. 25 TaxID=2302933 RepID=UPI0013D0C2D4|nr:hypothetical protein [Dysgonomonas sp. 25]NDV67632.1 hypothetical protein [Dysgonomonas sp. 25]
MKNKLYFIILLLLIITAFIIDYFIGFEGKSLGIYRISAAGVIVWYIWCKDTFTGQKWFKPKTIDEKIVNETYEKHRQTYIASLPLVNEKERNGYMQLAKLCVNKENRGKLLNFLSTLKDFSSDKKEYLTTLNYVLEYIDEEDIAFIIAFDYKVDVDTLEWELRNSIKVIYDIDIDFPEYDKKLAAFDKEFKIYKEHNNALNMHGLQGGFIRTQGAEYVIIIHKIADKPEIEKAVSDIGYTYFEK